MNKMRLIILLAGALLCAPAFTACQDDPEPVKQEEPESPSEEDPKIPDEPEKSWFDLPEEERWPIRWFFEDEDVCHGPGEYEFRVPTSGDEFTFWFPDCGQILKWVDFDGLVQLNYYEDTPVDNYAWNGASYKIVDENCVKIIIDPNGYSVPHRYVFSFHNCTDGGIARFIFHQDAGDGHCDGRPDGGRLLWISADEPLTTYHTTMEFLKDYRTLEIYPERTAKEFAIRCLNADNLIIKSLKYAKEPVRVVDSARAECRGSVSEIRNDSLICSLGKNDGNELKIYSLRILSGDGRTTEICIRQRYDETSFDKGRIYPYDPEWTVVEDGSRWTGGSTDNGVFRIQAKGDTLTISQTKIYKFITVEGALVNGKFCPKYDDHIYWGDFSDFDSGMFLDGAVSYSHHKTWDTLSLAFSPNYTGRERVMVLKIKYDVHPNKSLIYFISDSGFKYKFDPRSFLTGYDRFTFVQPPMNPSGK